MKKIYNIIRILIVCLESTVEDIMKEQVKLLDGVVGIMKNKVSGKFMLLKQIRLLNECINKTDLIF